jgi:hypothetical protein
MGFFTPRERAALGKSAELREQQGREQQGKVRELVRHDFTPRARPPYPERPNHHERPASPDRMPSPERPASHERVANPDLAGHVGTLMQRVSDTSVHEIDDLIAVLQRRREALLSESARMQREIIEYAKLNQATLQSTRIITESLASFRRVSDAPSLSEPHAEAFSEVAEREDAAESAAATDEVAPAKADEVAPDAQVEAPELAADAEKEPT